MDGYAVEPTFESYVMPQEHARRILVIHVYVQVRGAAYCYALGDVYASFGAVESVEPCGH